MLALSKSPDQYQKLRNNPDLVSDMVAETARWQTPVIHMRRTLSGNHDQAVFDDPDKLTLGHPHARADAAFGLGVQRCSGNRLAERQLRILMGRDYGALA
ncbi:MAG: hypothetical protein VYE04_12125 [Pseudomonadota bacterium]|nr:hypothetical protein [Pseudomonadota bacterium]